MPIPSNCPVLPFFQAWHKKYRPCSKIGNTEPLRVSRTTLRLMQRCNNVPFVFRSVEKQTLALVLTDDSSCKAHKIRYCMVSAPFRSPVCSMEDRNVIFVLFLFFQKRAFAFPAGTGAPYSFFVSQKQGTFRNAPYLFPNILLHLCLIERYCLYRCLGQSFPLYHDNSMVVPDHPLQLYSSMNRMGETCFVRE